jgi:hypothetical protein
MPLDKRPSGVWCLICEANPRTQKCCDSIAAHVVQIKVQHKVVHHPGASLQSSRAFACIAEAFSHAGIAGMACTTFTHLAFASRNCNPSHMHGIILAHVAAEQVQGLL